MSLHWLCMCGSVVCVCLCVCLYVWCVSAVSVVCDGCVWCVCICMCGCEFVCEEHGVCVIEHHAV